MICDAEHIRSQVIYDLRYFMTPALFLGVRG